MTQPAAVQGRRAVSSRWISDSLKSHLNLVFGVLPAPYCEPSLYMLLVAKSGTAYAWAARASMSLSCTLLLKAWKPLTG